MINYEGSKSPENRTGEKISIHGSIYKIRKMSNFSFVLLRTREGVIQCIYSREFSNFEEDLLVEEACVIFTAAVAQEERSRTGYELQLTEAKVLSTPKAPMPIVINQKIINTSIENLLDYRPITLRNEKERSIFKIQAAICLAFRSFLNTMDFTEIHTPKIVAEGAEGGANIFQLSYFGQDAYLAQSPQFYKQMMAGVFERVYEIAPVFRAEKHDTARHLNEYTSVDLELGYIESFEDIMAMEQDMLKFTMEYLANHCVRELELCKASLPVIGIIPQIKFAEAKEIISREYHKPITDMLDFEPEEEKLLCRYIEKTTGSELVFVTHYPSAKRPFYAMENPENENETLSFDLLFRGLEITTGGQRIHDFDMQTEKMIKRGMSPDSFASYLMMHKYGMPPHGGLGLGLERFTAKLLEFDNVRMAALFPRDIHRLIP